MLSRILIVDDVLGRVVPGGRNAERESFCAQFLWTDATDDEAAKANLMLVKAPRAEAVFCRGQTPLGARPGDLVENDLPGTLTQVRRGWWDAIAAGRPPWTLVLLDLCFYTGRVTAESDRRSTSSASGRPGDDDPRSYFGLALLQAIHSEFPELPVFILSSKPRQEVSLEFVRRGALGFVARDDSQAPELLREAQWQHGLLADPTGAIIGHSLPLLLAMREARRASRHRENVLVRGERGTGKELLASYIHRCSAEVPAQNSEAPLARPFVTVNSGAFPATLFASELFGIEPRTATGVDGKIGLIEAADGGDLFLDEIGDLPPEVQAAVLRVLQERQVGRVGGRKTKQIDVRFISATNAALEDSARGFRSDLLDRLRIGGTIWLPPLRERVTDIPLLVESFVRQAESERAGAWRREIVPDALQLLERHSWPGNVRELRTVVFDAVNRHADVEHLVPEHLRLPSAGPQISSTISPNRVGEAAFGSAAKSHVLSDEISDIAGPTIGGIFTTLKQIDFSPEDARRMPGRLATCQHAGTWLMARCLEAYLDAYRDSSTGQVLYQLAVRKALADEKISGARAADFIKRLLKPIANELSGTLLEAYNRAIKLRSVKSVKPSTHIEKANGEGMEP